MNKSTLVPREEMSDLDWLARNVHVWPFNMFDSKPTEKYVWHQPYCGGDILAIFRDRPSVFTKYQWLARRAELQNKPSWGSVGSDINFISQHDDGQWIGHSEKPSEAGECFECDCVVSLFGYGEVLGDWRDTLEKRPDMYKNKEEIDTSSECVHKTEESVHISELEMLAKVSHLISDKRHRNQFEPFVSAEDVKISILQSDGDVKNFGGIIGRNLLPEEDAAPTTQPFSQKVSVDGVEYLITSASASVNPSCAATAKQPAPKGSGNPILGMVLADLTNRALEGKEKYGEPLLAHNGRNPLWDAYQEALDLAMYLRQAIEEQK